MDDSTGFQYLLSWQFWVFCLGLAAITFVIRKAVEFFILDNPKMPGSRTSSLWRNLLLPIAPICNGVIIGFFAKQYPYPEGISSASGRVFFGLVAGLLSSTVYRLAWNLVKDKIPANINNVVAPNPNNQEPDSELDK